jgi:hypothetical protein
MKLLRIAIGMAALVACGALSPIVVANPVVPPGNSAATQYTETFPTSHGAADMNKEIDGSEIPPSKVLGSDKAKKLESKGADGKAVAEITAATAPVQVEPEVDTTASEQPPAKSPDEPGGKDQSDRHAAAGGGGGGGHSGGSGGGGGKPAASATAPPAQSASLAVEPTSGSSGLGQVLEEATGSSSGQLGLLLPLLIVGTIAWSFNYAWRQRRAAG